MAELPPPAPPTTPQGQREPTVPEIGIDWVLWRGSALPMKIAGLLMILSLLLLLMIRSFLDESRYALKVHDVSSSIVLNGIGKALLDLGTVMIITAGILLLISIPQMTKKRIEKRLIGNAIGLNNLINERALTLIALNDAMTQSMNDAERYAKLSEIHQEAARALLTEINQASKPGIRITWFAGFVFLALSIVAGIVIAIKL